MEPRPARRYLRDYDIARLPPAQLNQMLAPRGPLGWHKHPVGPATHTPAQTHVFWPSPLVQVAPNRIGRGS
jgi:hypothetical protein